MSRLQDKLEILSAGVRPDQKAAVIQYAKDSGCLSISEGVRDILDEWARYKARENGLTQMNGLKLSEV